MALDVKKLFLELTTRTYPHGTEEELEPILYKYVPNLQKDEYGNYYLLIGMNPSVMFTSHLDTACGYLKEVNHVIKGNIIQTDNNSLLGADCKAGVVSMFYMIEHGIEGLYYFFLGEEVGCQGSRWLSSQMSIGKLFSNLDINKVISFDRRGYSSIITHQCYGRCASDEFADSLIEEFSKCGMVMKKDPTGILTDSIQFQSFIPECTNISVGYMREHTDYENQDIEYLNTLCEALIKINWESLSVSRDPSVEEYDYGWGSYEEEFDEEFDFGLEDIDTKTWNEDYKTTVKHPYTGQDIEVLISEERIDKELEIIEEIIEIFEIISPKTPWMWDGDKLSYKEGSTTVEISRRKLKIYDARLGSVSYDDIKLVSEIDN